MMVAAVLLQAGAGSAGIGGIAPVAQADVSLWLVAAFAAFNPAVIAVGFAMGRRADQPAKLLVAAFAAALAGVATIWLGALLRIPGFATPGRAAAGIFVMSMVFGGLWASLSYRRRR